jgi:hypothetical protein
MKETHCIALLLASDVLIIRNGHLSVQDPQRFGLERET